MRRNFNGALLAILATATTAAPVLARGNDLVIKDGFGEQVTVKHGFFGRKTTVVKDRLGDGYATKTGLFGSKEQDVNVLGNSFQRKKGLLGSTEISGGTIFGDKVQTKKGIFGRRTTYVDASGSATAIKALWDANKGKILGTTANPNPVCPPNGSVQTTPMDGDAAKF
jgi:hypothetical protein